jgi:hypothetical protein
MNLQFMVKRFYDTSVRIIPEAKNIVPEYPRLVFCQHMKIVNFIFKVGSNHL